MTTLTTKLIATLAVAAGLLTANATFAGGNSRSGNFNSHVGNTKFSSGSNTLGTSSNSSNTFRKGVNPTKVLSSTILSSNSGSKNVLRNGVDPTKVLSSTILSGNSNGKNPGRDGIDPTKVLGKTGLGGTTIIKDPIKCDWKKFCYRDHCSHPYYFGCSYPSYGCYDYCSASFCYPKYECNYVNSLTALPALEWSPMLVAPGSTLTLNGQAFGNNAGGARLRISGMALPIQVIEWTPNAVKVQLPQLELTSVTLADIEVVRPDGSLVSKTAVELTAASQQLALSR